MKWPICVISIKIVPIYIGLQLMGCIVGQYLRPVKSVVYRRSCKHDEGCEPHSQVYPDEYSLGPKKCRIHLISVTTPYRSMVCTRHSMYVDVANKAADKANYR